MNRDTYFLTGFFRVAEDLQKKRPGVNPLSNNAAKKLEMADGC